LFTKSNFIAIRLNWILDFHFIHAFILIFAIFAFA